MTRVFALYPGAIAALLVGLPILAPRSGPLALACILSVHLALAALLLVPVAIARRGVVLRSSLAVLAVVAVARFGGEWLSMPPSDDPNADLFEAASWNLQISARSGADAVDAIAVLDIDVVAIQEVGPEHARAISESTELAERYPSQRLYPDPGFVGIGLLSPHPILRADHADDPSVLEAVLDVGGQEITVITAHPLPGHVMMAGPVPVGFDPGTRDDALRRVRARIDAAIGRGETVVVLGDFNVAPTEAAFGELVDGLRDAHGEVGQGAGWTWRPRIVEWTGLGLLRIDLVLSSPDLPPVSVAERCGRVGDHCLLEASFSLVRPR